MKNFENENILRLIIKSLLPHCMLKKTFNKLLQSIILSTLDYNEIYKRLGKSESILSTHNMPKVALLSNGNIATNSDENKLKVFNKDTYKCQQIEEVIYTIAALPNCIIACSHQDRIKFLNAKEDYKCVMTILLNEGWASFRDLYVLPNNDIACTIFLNRPVSIVIYHSNNNYQSFKLLADPCEPYMSITGLSGNQCAILTYRNHIHIMMI
jgi:hypothetical protein